MLNNVHARLQGATGSHSPANTRAPETRRAKMRNLLKKQDVDLRHHDLDDYPLDAIRA